jgi:hypothetical protein
MSEVLSDGQIQEIRYYVKKYNSKIDVANKFGLSYNTVLFYTRDIQIKRSKIKHNVIKRTPMKITINHSRSISGRSLNLLKELVKNGYALSSDSYGLEEYIRLKKDFPQIKRMRMYGRVIYFFDGKEKIVEKALLEALNKKVISYQEIKQITKIFNSKLENKDKDKHLQK